MLVTLYVNNHDVQTKTMLPSPVPAVVPDVVATQAPASPRLLDHFFLL